ncbi:MAG: CpsD/CapB family tyrosine-protein kinase [Deltaproteobacteria bacterium]|nr:CpsD/CapB family tyrosine-protein kinase [Deltaproteobacteria bacterium]MDL1960238.1 CpsD/CapB family tyrosine-protein kinase [Deltaproteobacteria bacterium]
MGKTFEAIEQAKREKDSQKAMAPPQLKERDTDTHPEDPVTLIDTKKKQVLLPTSFEQYQQLKTSLLNRYPDLKHKVIMLVSSSENEGCTTTAVNLARALASDDKIKVLLIDGNLRSSSLHQAFGLDNKNGLSDIIRGDSDTEQAIKKTDIENLFVVTGGKNDGNSASILDSSELKPLLDQLKERFDFVILDAPPVTLYSDSISLCSKVDGVISVVEAEKTRWEVAEGAKEKLKAAGARILGGVLNKRKYHIPQSVYKRL